MAKYKISKEAEADLIRIHHYGMKKFGVAQADAYFHTFFEYFELIAQHPFSFESVDFMSEGVRRCPCGADSIYYTLSEGVVEILAIIGKQDLNNIF
jgi:toxin ParE1/3/4